MALKIADGFDHYNSLSDLLNRSGFLQWQYPQGQPLLAFVTGLNGSGKAVQNSGQPARIVRAVFADRNAEGYIGIRINIPLQQSLNLTLKDTVANVTQVDLFFNNNNYSITATQGNGTVLGISANNAWTGATNQFVEIHYKIANSGGIIEVRIRDVAVLTVTGADTQNGSNAWADALDILPPNGGVGFTASVIFDDFYYCDTTSDSGSFANNTYMGDVGVRTLFATGDGTVHWTPNSGANNYSRINETAMDSDTSYNSSSNAGDEDQFPFAPITNVVPIIYSLQVTIAARKDDVGPRVIKTGLKSSATVSYGSNHSVPDTYAYFTDAWILDPNTSANWTRTAVNAVLGLYNLVS